MLALVSVRVLFAFTLCLVCACVAFVLWSFVVFIHIWFAVCCVGVEEQTDRAQRFSPKHR